MYFNAFHTIITPYLQGCISKSYLDRYQPRLVLVSQHKNWPVSGVNKWVSFGVICVVDGSVVSLAPDGNVVSSYVIAGKHHFPVTQNQGANSKDEKTELKSSYLDHPHESSSNKTLVALHEIQRTMAYEILHPCNSASIIYSPIYSKISQSLAHELTKTSKHQNPGSHPPQNLPKNRLQKMSGIKKNIEKTISDNFL